ncbi:MAG: hypothetical protein ACKUBY_00920 [Candidatus Moraniibacteriota bacterium]|jgi:hypothetical protein
MKKKMIIVAVVLFIFVGCGGVSSQFPLPEKVENFMEQGSVDSINFQTSLSMDEVVDFYKKSLTDQGLVERELLTVRQEGVSSMVFDGHVSGKAIIVQSTNLPNEKVNVNIRLEEI